MIDNYFKKTSDVIRFRSGPTGPYVDSFAAKLGKAGYNYWTIRGYIRAAFHLGLWLKSESIELTQLNEQSLDRFREHLSDCRCLKENKGKYHDAAVGARHLLEHLRLLGVVPVASPAEPMPKSLLLQQFEDWMCQHRGVTLSTLEVYRRVLVELLSVLGEQPEHFTPQALCQFVLKHAKGHGRDHAKIGVTAVRMFLRYLAAHARCDAKLIDAIPVIAHWKLSSLPRYLPADDIERVIQACDVTSAMGRRDRAVILLLARLGLRAGDVAELGLSDINWKEANLRVSGKGRRETRLPLPQDVGDAILAYIQAGRPRIEDDNIFVRTRAPLGPLTRAAVTLIVSRAIHRAKVDAPSHGAHLLRHSAATEMLRQGASLEAIGSVLRHRSTQATLHYAKVDVGLLRPIALPWPTEVVS